MVFYVRGRHWSCWCWLLLINADSWWLLLVAAGCWMISGCGWDTAVCWKIAACGWDTAGCWMIAGCGWDTFAGEKILQYSQDIDDLRLRQSLQAKKSLNISRILMICGWDTFAGKKDLEYSQNIGDLRLRQICRRKILWKLTRYRWFAAKTTLQAKTSSNFFRILMICG